MNDRLRGHPGSVESRALVNVPSEPTPKRGLRRGTTSWHAFIILVRADESGSGPSRVVSRLWSSSLRRMPPDRRKPSFSESKRLTCLRLPAESVVASLIYSIEVLTRHTTRNRRIISVDLIVTSFDSAFDVSDFEFQNLG